MKFVFLKENSTNMINRHTKQLLIVLSFFFSILSQAQIRLDKNTTYVDENGKNLSYEKFQELHLSSQYSNLIKKKENGEIYVQLEKLPIGELAPSYEFTDIDGHKIISETLKGKVVVFNFWFTTCKPCIKELPELNNMVQKYKDNPNVVFISIAKDKEERVKKFLKIHRLDYKLVIGDRSVCNEFNIKGFPTNMVIDKNGKYAFIKKAYGRNTIEKITAAIESVL